MSIKQLKDNDVLQSFIKEARLLRKAVNTKDKATEQYQFKRICNLNQDCFFNLLDFKVNGKYVRCPVLCEWFIDYCDNNYLLSKQHIG